MAKKVAPYAAGGAVVGAGTGVMQGNRVPQLQKQVQSMEAEGDGGFGRAVDLAKTKAELSIAQASQKHPGAAALSGAASGALGMSLLGPMAVGSAKRLHSGIKKYRAIGK